MQVAGRMALFLLAVMLVAGLLCSVLVGAIRPFIRGSQLSARNAILQKKLDKQRDLNEQMDEKITWLNSPEGIVDRARRNGMVKPGEERVSMQVDHPQQQSALPAPKTPVAPSVPETNILALALTLFALAFVLGGGMLLYRRRLAQKKRPVGVLTPRSELRRRRKNIHEPVREH
jgi:cell division protein FtsB